VGKQLTETFWAKGHPNIQAIHPTTLMFTKDVHVSKNGDCIVAMSAEKSVVDLSSQFKEGLHKPNAKVTVTLEADDLKEEIQAVGHPNLCLCHPTDIVIRKSDYTCHRTLGIFADKSAADLSREFVAKLQNPEQKIKITLTVET
jgi:uncharacterized protein